MAAPGFLSSRISKLFQNESDASAGIEGIRNFSRIKGKTEFYQTKLGVVAATYVMGLPLADADLRPRGFPVHICAGNGCFCGEKNGAGVFDAMPPAERQSEKSQPFSGYMPPLYASHAFALSVFLTDYFNIRDILGLHVVIHPGVDICAPLSGKAFGEKIAAGLIVKN